MLLQEREGWFWATNSVCGAASIAGNTDWCPSSDAKPRAGRHARGASWGGEGLSANKDVLRFSRQKGHFRTRLAPPARNLFFTPLLDFNSHFQIWNSIHCVCGEVWCVLREHSVSVAIFVDQTQPVFSSFQDEMQIFELRKWKWKEGRGHDQIFKREQHGQKDKKRERQNIL